MKVHNVELEAYELELLNNNVEINGFQENGYFNSAFGDSTRSDKISVIFRNEAAKSDSNLNKIVNNDIDATCDSESVSSSSMSDLPSVASKWSNVKKAVRRLSEMSEAEVKKIEEVSKKAEERKESVERKRSQQMQKERKDKEELMGRYQVNYGSLPQIFF